MIRIEVNCETGAVEERAMTDEETAAHQKTQAEAQVAEQRLRETLAANEQARQVVRQKAVEDPSFAALVRLLGITREPRTGRAANCKDIANDRLLDTNTKRCTRAR